MKHKKHTHLLGSRSVGSPSKPPGSVLTLIPAQTLPGSLLASEASRSSACVGDASGTGEGEARGAGVGNVSFYSIEDYLHSVRVLE